MIGEVWEDASHKVSYGELRRYLDGHELDSATNYPLRQALLDYLMGRCTPETAWRHMIQLYENYPPDNFQAALNLIGSHDRPRILTLLGGAPPEESLNEFERERFRLTPDMEALAVKRLHVLLLLQMLLPGNACIYYGDETGMQGYSDPYNRGPFPWDKPHEELRVIYHRLIGLRQQYRDLGGGTFTPVYDDGDVLGFRLRRENEELLVCVNRSPEERYVEWRESAAGSDFEPWHPAGEYRFNISGGIYLDERPLRIVDLLDEPEYGDGDGLPTAIRLQPLGGKAFYIRYPEEKSGGAGESAALKPYRRCAGVLMHLTSLPSPWGIGTMGAEAYGFVDFLAAAGQRLWQVLPLNPAGGGNSPYQSGSLLAGNIRLISPELLAQDGWLTENDLDEWRERMADGAEQRVDYAKLAPVSDDMLKRAFERYRRAVASGAAAEFQAEFDAYCEGQNWWLDDYALYAALKGYLGQESWQQWPEPLALRREPELSAYRQRLREQIDCHRFGQFVFNRQWLRLKAYAAARNIAMVGDMPIYAATDSCDTWVYPHLFRLDEEGYPSELAGVPPDYFCAAGQLWENPIYDWRAMEAESYGWWVRRVRQGLKNFDYLRLDHFRGLEAGWAVPRDCPDAKAGQWRRGPGRKLLRALELELGELPLIAENLGFITRDVESIRECFALPGMKILQFTPLDAENRPALTPGERSSVLYSGTHDNETLLGWLLGCGDEGGAMAEEAALDKADDLLEKLYASPSPWVILPLQDVLLLDNAARMNIPGTASGNWEWRALPPYLSSEVAARLYARTARGQRI